MVVSAYTSRMKRKIIIILALSLGCISLLVIGFVARIKEMNNQLNQDYESIASIDLSQKPNGTYIGRFEAFLVSVDLTVKVEGGRIKEIIVNRQSSGPGYEARETVERILQAQTPGVEVVSGASGSSKAIMIAVYRALK